MSMKDTVLGLAICGFMSVVSNVLATKATIMQSITGVLVLIIIALLGIAASKYLPGGIPAAAYVVTIGCILTIPGVPGAATIAALVKPVGFVALCTQILAYAGIAIGKDLDAFSETGWRICVLAIFVFTGTYLASAIIAQFILKALGQI